MATAKKKMEMIPRDSDKSAKQKALKTAIAQLEKDFGQGTIMKLGENTHMEVQAVSTGSISLDVALGIGGVPRGRIIEIFGPESSGKTTVALHIVAEVQKRSSTLNTLLTPFTQRLSESISTTFSSHSPIAVRTRLILQRLSFARALSTWW